MSLLATVQAFIELNPGLTTREIASALPEYERFDVQRAASHLCLRGRVTRQKEKGLARYFASKSEAVTAKPAQKRASATSRRKGSGDPQVIADLVSRAEELESKGFFNRAATVWLEAFSESMTKRERDEFLRRRQKCLSHSKKRTRPVEQVYLAGRFVGNVE